MAVPAQQIAAAGGRSGCRTARCRSQTSGVKPCTRLASQARRMAELAPQLLGPSASSRSAERRMIDLARCCSARSSSFQVPCELPAGLLRRPARTIRRSRFRRSAAAQFTPRRSCRRRPVPAACRAGMARSWPGRRLPSAPAESAPGVDRRRWHSPSGSASPRPPAPALGVRMCRCSGVRGVAGAAGLAATGRRPVGLDGRQQVLHVLVEDRQGELAGQCSWLAPGADRRGASAAAATPIRCPAPGSPRTGLKKTRQRSSQLLQDLRRWPSVSCWRPLLCASALCNGLTGVAVRPNAASQASVSRSSSGQLPDGRGHARGIAQIALHLLDDSALAVPFSGQPHCRAAWRTSGRSSRSAGCGSCSSSCCALIGRVGYWASSLTSCMICVRAVVRPGRPGRGSRICSPAR